jgi:hypothetical protein
MGDTPTGKIVATVVPALVMVIALFMILDQLRIAETIVTIAFAATMGALALGLALAFGLGGRDVARRLLEDAYAQGRRAKDQARQDFAVGRDRAEESLSGYQTSGTTADAPGSHAAATASTSTGTAGAYDGHGAATSGPEPGTWNR